jgi:hypothetical protein
MIRSSLRDRGSHLNRGQTSQGSYTNIEGSNASNVYSPLKIDMWSIGCIVY